MNLLLPDISKIQDYYFGHKKKIKNGPTTEELIERGFSPKDGKIHILLINPPSTISERYGRKDLGEVGGDMIPLGIACLAGYLREKGYGVGVLDCPTLKIDSNRVYEIIKQKDPAIIGFSTTTYALTRAIEIAEKILEKELANKEQHNDMITQGVRGLEIK